MNKRDMSDLSAAVGAVTLAGIVAAILRTITTDEVTFWTAATAVLTAMLGFIAWYQIGRLENAQRGWETLRVCGLYDVDPTIDKATRIIMAANDRDDYAHISYEAALVLNYFTTLAIGIEQGFYIERIVRAQLGRVIRTHAEDLLAEEHASQLEITPDDFAPLRRLLKRW